MKSPPKVTEEKRIETKESDGGNDDVDYEVFEADEVENAVTEMTLTGDYVSALSSQNTIRYSL